MSQPLVSIVTPTLNRVAMLEATLRSVRSQTYPNVEHIVMDGGSADGTVDLLQRYEQTYQMRWWSEVDAGMYPAINQGLQRTKGEILAYLNSDDLYFPWTIDVVVQAFRDHPDADFIFGDALAIDNETGEQTMYLFPPFNLDLLRRTGFLAQAAVFWRRGAFEAEGPFDESLRYVADCDYWMRAGERRRFVKLNEFLAIERNHGETLREAIGSPLWAELDAVRARYVSSGDAHHTKQVSRYLRREKLWARRTYAGLLFASLLPARLRRGAWSHFMRSPNVRLNRLRVLLRTIPGIGLIGVIANARKGDLLRPGRAWLEPE